VINRNIKHLTRNIDDISIVSYSPRRLSKGYYCGKAAYHDRFRPDAPNSLGLTFGSNVDTDIANIIKGEPIVSEYMSPAVEYFIMNTPAIDENTSADGDSIIELEIDKQPIRIAGYYDVKFKEKVVEVKTGKQKIWHEIQALCYAVSFNLPCQIIYVTRGYSVYVQPDKDKLIDIVKTAIKNELSDNTSRNEHCDFCQLKMSCPQWDKESSIFRVLVGYHELLDSPDIDEKGKFAIQYLFEHTESIIKKYLIPGTSHNIDNYKVRVNGRDKVSSITYKKQKNS